MALQALCHNNLGFGLFCLSIQCWAVDASFSSLHRISRSCAHAPNSSTSMLTLMIDQPLFMRTKQDGKLICVPYYQILGVSKCGTTDLYHRLSQHPQVFKAANKVRE
eukprot:292480-Pelagomonas_calceolata.AAC.9